jgi:hypothetical protein
MSRQVVEEVLARAMEDEQFRRRLLREPEPALRTYDLTPAEREALIAGDLRRVLLEADADA